ncbi:MAG: hypothetical protein CVU51_00980 [Deltaproteobacteria bacterium HGW-Deltaproteobacteria-1]|jgi:acyl-coenzyme A thioesterase PaaI-like protein|nr:MAG: hypothetical protein CVU51_00980 [Deltaproteobacteria bacterium HGW-Deltaproteobacteria-1]
MEEQAIKKYHDAAMGELLPVQTDVPRCFVCGLENPSGLKLRFRKEGPTSVSTQFTATYDWTGWGNILHGGFQALLLDEITAWVPFGLWNERTFVTKEMRIRYVKPAYVEMPLFIVGYLVEDMEREIIVRGEIKDERGCILSEARCTLVRLSKEAMVRISC